MCTACSVRIMWYSCVFLFSWLTNWSLYLGEDLFWDLMRFSPSLLACLLVPFLSRSCLSSQAHETSWVIVVSRRHSFTENTLFFGLLNLPPHLSAVILKPDVQRCVCWVGLSSSAFWWLVVFCNGLHVLQREVPWWRVRIAVRNRSHSSPGTHLSVSGWPQSQRALPAPASLALALNLWLFVECPRPAWVQEEMEAGVVTPASQHLSKIPLVFTLFHGLAQMQSSWRQDRPRKSGATVQKRAGHTCPNNKYISLSKLRNSLGNWEKQSQNYS